MEEEDGAKEKKAERDPANGVRHLRDGQKITIPKSGRLPNLNYRCELSATSFRIRLAVANEVEGLTRIHKMGLMFLCSRDNMHAVCLSLE
jgi:hypothetical protein